MYNGETSSLAARPALYRDKGRGVNVPSLWNTCVCVGMSHDNIDLLRDARDFGPHAFSQVGGILDLLALLYEQKPRYVVIELPVVGMSWLLALRSVRGIYDGPLIVIGDEADEPSRAMSLEMGADHFLPRAVSPRLLYAHLKASDRSRSLSSEARAARARTARALAVVPDPDEVVFPRTIEACGWWLDTRFCVLTAPNGKPVKLTDNERTLLGILMQASPEPISRSRVSQCLRGRERNPTNRSLDVIMCRLRAKLRAVDDGNPIQSLRNWGYWFAEPMAD